MERKTLHYEIKNNNSLKFLVFNNSDFQGTTHAFFTRLGGVSAGHLSSLNMGGGLGDTQENLIENHKRIFSVLGRKVNSSYDVWQVHSTDVIFTERPRKPGEAHKKGDAIFTDNPEVTLLMRFADCVPILLYNARQKIVGIVHAGWKGTINEIALKAINRACEFYNAVSSDWIAGIGPSIGPDHYEVGKEIKTLGKAVFGTRADEIFFYNNGKIYMDLWKANSYILEKSGVNNIYSMNVCTACDTTLWFSHRAESSKTGRFAGLISLE